MQRSESDSSGGRANLAGCHDFRAVGPSLVEHVRNGPDIRLKADRFEQGHALRQSTKLIYAGPRALLRAERGPLTGDVHRDLKRIQSAASVCIMKIDALDTWLLE